MSLDIGLSDRVVLITGGGSRIGLAVAERIAKLDAKVVVSDPDIEAAVAVAEKLSHAGGQVAAYPVDLTNASSCSEIVSFTLQRFGSVSGLFNSAVDSRESILGVDSRSDILTIPSAVWNRTIDVTLTGSFNMTRAVVPAMLDANGGAIVYEGSASPFVGEPVRAAHAVAVAGVTALSRHVASRWGKLGIQSNCIAVGPLEGGSSMTDARGADMEAWVQRSRSARRGSHTDAAGLVTFLLSKNGSYINGQVISIDGGLTAR